MASNHWLRGFVFFSISILSLVTACDKSAHSSASESIDQVEAPPPAPPPPPPPPALPAPIAKKGPAGECSDGKDNDNDGLVDWQYDLGCHGPDDSTEGGLETRAIDDGWTVFEPSKDTRIIYVSSSTGNDANKGTSPKKPKKSIRAAMRAARGGFPDWVLLARGDTWTEGFAYKEGRSRTEPFVVATYGDSTERPLLKTGNEQSGIENNGLHFNNFAIVGIKFYAHTRDPGSPSYVGPESAAGFAFFSKAGATGQGVLFEDCWFDFYSGNSIMGDGDNKDIVLRRNLITNNYATSGHPQGLYSKNASMTLEENVFDHNGWYKQAEPKSTDPAGGAATIFNHNTYFVNHKNTKVVGNTFLRASSIQNKWTANDGPASASDLVIDNNLYVDGEIGMSIGGNDNVHPHRFKNVRVINNVITDIGRSRPTHRTLGWCIDIDDWDGGELRNNLCVHQRDPLVDNVYAIDVRGVNRHVVVADNIFHGLHTNRFLIKLSEGEKKQDISFVNNKLQSPEDEAVLVHATGSLSNYAFKGNEYFSALSPDEWFNIDGKGHGLEYWRKETGATGVARRVRFPDSTRTIETYQAALGKEASIDAFIEAVLKQSKYNWRPQYTAGAVNDYLRAGFGAAKAAR